MNKIKIENNLLIDMYLNQKLSMTAISKITGIYPEWISKRLKQLNIPKRKKQDKEYHKNQLKNKKPCYICGIVDTQEYKDTGKFYCSKHHSQLHKFGKILERTKFESNNIYIFENYAVIDLYNKKNIKNGECIIDIEDIDVIKNYKWHLDRQGYVTTNIKGNDQKKHRLTMHRLLLNPSKNILIDHINLNKSDNRRKNLRFVNKSKNEMNKPLRKDNRSGFRGVYKDTRCNSWDAELTINGEKVLRKTFKTKEEAVEARKEAELKYFGKYRYQGVN